MRIISKHKQQRIKNKINYIMHCLGNAVGEPTTFDLKIKSKQTEREEEHTFNVAFSFLMRKK